MLSNMKNAHIGGNIDNNALLKMLRNHPLGNSIPLHVRAQNAGILIKPVEEGIQFDVFELSPTNGAVMTTNGRLQRSFPGVAVTVTYNDFTKTGFRETVADTLAGMSSQAVAGMQPQARKTRSLHDEDRDTTHPGMVSELLTGFLSAVGQNVPSPAITKNTREEVFCNNARSPWRRSATWLLIRVALQLSLPRATYKEAMLFIMSGILKTAVDQALPSETIYAMIAKIARRLLKIGSSINKMGDDAVRHVEEIMREANNTISNRWTDVQQKYSTTLDLAKLADLDFDSDSRSFLPALDTYLESLSSRQAIKSSRSFIPVSDLVAFTADQLPTLSFLGFNDKGSPVANLQAFEYWVASHCRQWSLANASDTSNTCIALGSLLENYHTLAKHHYSQNPEALFIMFLTILEIWVACDKAAIRMCPLLGDCQPGLPEENFQSLLLPYKSQMEKLHDLESYIAGRRSGASYPCVISNQNLENPDCFAVKYFESSDEHKDLLGRITAWATLKRRDKISELEQVKQQHDDLMRRYDEGKCDMYEVVVDAFNDFREQRHCDGYCRRCSYSNQANNLEIDIDEWPLPTNATKARAVIFELRVPEGISSYRDTTAYVLLNVLQAE